MHHACHTSGDTTNPQGKPNLLDQTSSITFTTNRISSTGRLGASLLLALLSVLSAGAA
jgi:hypothetical protein